MTSHHDEFGEGDLSHETEDDKAFHNVKWAGIGCLAFLGGCYLLFLLLWWFGAWVDPGPRVND